jgi:catechol 2,3-dioxygenase-like lactoylglutathione lyase family enzyme
MPVSSQAGARLTRALFFTMIAAIAGCIAPAKVVKPMNNPNYHLSLLKIPVSNISKSAEFYRDLLKFKEEFVAEQYGWAQFSAGDLALALYKPGMGGGDGKVGGSTGFHLALPPEQFDALSVDLLKRGVLVDNRVQRGDDGTTYIQVRDPDGNVLNVGRAAAQ